MAGGGTTLEYTPTWVVAVICTFIVAISLAVERCLHCIGTVWYTTLRVHFFFVSKNLIRLSSFIVFFPLLSETEDKEPEAAIPGFAEN